MSRKISFTRKKTGREATTGPYSKSLLELSRNTKHVGEIKNAHRSAEGSNPRCGDEIRVFVIFDSAVKKMGKGGSLAIKKVSFTAHACALCSASANLMCDLVEGISQDKVKGVQRNLKKFLINSRVLEEGKISTRSASAKEMAEAFKPFAAVTGYSSRISCVLLPWEVLEKALD